MIENDLLREFAEAYPDGLESKLAQAFDEKIDAPREEAVKHLREKLEDLLQEPPSPGLPGAALGSSRHQS